MKKIRKLQTYKLNGQFTAEVMEKVESAQRIKDVYTFSRLGRTLASYSFGRSARRKMIWRRISILRR